MDTGQELSCYPITLPTRSDTFAFVTWFTQFCAVIY